MKTQKGFAHLLLLLLLLVGLGVGIFLVQKTQIFKSKASVNPVEFTGDSVFKRSGQQYTSALTVGLRLTPPSGVSAQSVTNKQSLCPPKEIRDEAKAIFTSQKEVFFRKSLDAFNKGKKLDGVYDLQIFTQNLLEMSVYCEDTDLLQQLTDLYDDPYVSVKKLDGNPTEYKWLVKELVNGKETGKEYEYMLGSTQYLYLISRTINIISSLPEERKTAALKDFVIKFSPVVDSHYRRWIFDEKPFTLNPGWGCSNKTRYSHADYINQIKNKTMGNSPTYCNLVSDIDMWIIAGSEEYLMASRQDPKVFISSRLKDALPKYLKDGSDLLKDRFNQTTLQTRDGKTVSGVNFDAGIWRDHPDYKFAGYAGAEFPTTDKLSKVPQVGWDLSHARRFVNVFGTLYRNRQRLGLDFPTKTEMEMLANQFTYKIYNGDPALPLFTNYFDGSNGWYRVGHNGPGFGFAPYDASIAAAEGGFGFWSEFNPEIGRSMKNLYKIFKATDAATMKLRKEHYGQNNKDVSVASGSAVTFDTARTEYDLGPLKFLMFLPTIPQQDSSGYKISERALSDTEWDALRTNDYQGGEITTNYTFNSPQGGVKTLFVQFIGAGGGKRVSQAYITYEPKVPASSAQDTFDRPDSRVSLGQAKSGQSWEVIKGEFGVSNNQALVTGGCPAPGYAVINSNSYVGTLQVALPVNTQDVRIPFRVIDAENMYFMERNGDGYYIVRRENGKQTTLMRRVVGTPKDGDVVKLTLSASSIELFINDQKLSTIDDPNPLKGTKHGIGTWCDTRMRFDNFIFVPIIP